MILTVEEEEIEETEETEEAEVAIRSNKMTMSYGSDTIKNFFWKRIFNIFFFLRDTINKL